jgi:carbonic anhydrase/acetyltransferase-like protein (isoleucine patch superfamily)
MKAYIINTSKTIEPFGDHPRDCLIANKTLRELQESALRSLGIEFTFIENSQINDSEEHLVLTDSLYFDKELIAEFVAKSRELQRNTVCAIKSGVFTIRTITSTQDVISNSDFIEYNLRYISPNLRQSEAIPVIFDVDKLHENIRMPEHMLGSNGYNIPLPDKVAVQIDHWTNLWAANIGSLLLSVASVMRYPKWKLLGTALRARSFNQWNVVSKLNRIGHNCDIHPKAYVEGSVIGDNVKIGAGSIVRECNIGSNVSIENNVLVNFSVIGEGSTLIDSSRVRYSVIYPNTFFGYTGLSCQLIGRNCFIGGNVLITDYRMDGKNITVIKDDKVVNTENRILGCCIGHNSYLAAGTIIAPGRAIPNGTRIIPEYYNVIQKINPDGTIPDYRHIPQ